MLTKKKKKFKKINCNVLLTSLYLKNRKKLGEGGGGWSKKKLRIENCVFATANSQLLNVNIIMAFQLPIMEMAFALNEFKF